MKKSSRTQKGILSSGRANFYNNPKKIWKPRLTFCYNGDKLNSHFNKIRTATTQQVKKHADNQSVGQIGPLF